MATKLALQAAVEVGTTTPPESETELANAPTPDTASGAINGDSKMGAGSKTQATPSSPSSDLLRKLQLQVEFYFSPQNLKNDPYLVSQMNAEKYVPIRLITSFPKIAAMTTEQSVVAQAVSNSLVCSVDASGTMIKPIATAMPTVERNTIILRDLKNSTEEDIQQLFQSNESCGTIVSLRSDIGDTWFVTMESEEIAKDSLLALRMGKGFNGVKIKGSLKTVSMYSAAAAASGRSSFGSNAIDAPAFVPSFMPASNGGASKEAAPKFDNKKQQPKSLMGTGRQINNPMGGSATAEQQTAALAQYYGISVPEIKQVMNGMNPFMYTQMMNSNYYMSLMAQQNGNGGNNGGYGNRGNYSNNNKNFRNNGRNNGNRTNKDYNNNRNNNGNYINQPPLSNSKGRQQSQSYYTPLNGTGHVQQLQPHPNHNNNHNNNNHNNNSHHNSHHNNSHPNHANKTMLVQPMTKKKKKQVDPNMAVPSQMSGGGNPLKHKKKQKDDGTTGGNNGGTGNGSGIKELSPATHINVKELAASNPRSGIGRVPRGDHKELKPSSTSTSTAVANKKKNKNNNKNAASTSTNQSGNATFVPPASAPNFTSTAAFPTLGGPGNSKNNAAPSPWSASTSAVKKKPVSSKLHKKVTAPTTSMNSMNSTDSTMDHKSTAKKEDPSATLSSNNTTPTRPRSKKDPSSPPSDMETTAVSTSNAPFSWAATVKKTANVPVQEKVKPAPVSKKSDKSKKNKRNRKKDASPSSSSSSSSSTATKEAVSDIVNSMVNTVGDAGSSSAGTSGSTTPPTVTMPSKTSQQLTPTRRSGKTSWADAADEDSDESDDESDDLSPNRRGGGSLRSALSATYGEDASKTVGTTAGSSAGNAQPATRRGWEPVGVTKSRQIAKPSSSSTTATTTDTTKIEKTGGWANIVKKQASPSSGEATANMSLNSRAQAFK